MILKNMEYMSLPVNQTVAMGTHKGHDYVVKNYGTHPCCYVSMPNGKAIDKEKIKCHGGVTWCGKRLPQEEPMPNIWWIGWDYCHFGDYYGPYGWGKRWTAEELEQECIDVIEQIEGE